MLYSEKHYLFRSRRDLISKFNNYKNINELSLITAINLDFVGLKHKSASILGLCFFYLFLGLKGKTGFSLGKRLKKMMFCSLSLKKKNVFSFLEKYIFIHLYNSLSFDSNFKKQSLSNVGTFSFIINDIYKFLEFEESIARFRYLKNLKINFVFSKTLQKENLALLKSLGFSLKK